MRHNLTSAASQKAKFNNERDTTDSGYSTLTFAEYRGDPSRESRDSVIANRAAPVARVLAENSSPTGYRAPGQTASKCLQRNALGRGMTPSTGTDLGFAADIRAATSSASA